MPEDYSMDTKIWNNGKEYFIEITDFDIYNKTQLPKGTELTVYNKSTHVSEMTCFSDPEGSWIKY